VERKTSQALKKKIFKRGNDGFQRIEKKREYEARRCQAGAKYGGSVGKAKKTAGQERGVGMGNLLDVQKKL